MSEPALVGNWSEYQRLVLAELERHNVLLGSLDARIQQVFLQIETIKQYEKKIQNLEERLETNSQKIRDLQQAENIDDSISKYKKWLIGVIVIFVTSLAIPVINIVIQILSG